MVTDPGVIVAAVALLNQTLERVDIVASRFRSDSEINALRRTSVTGDPVPVSGDLLEAIEIALRAARLTDGAVDPTVGTAMCRLGYDRDFSVMERHACGALPEPGPVPGWQSIIVDVERSLVTLLPGTLLDLGATAKAWAADRAVEAITSRLGCGALVSLGGDIAVGGDAPDGGFSVGIADVCGDPAAPVAVSIVSGGLATSGIGNRHWTLGGHPVHHLIDPATGRSVDSPWRTVSVAACSCVDANTGSTARDGQGRRGGVLARARASPCPAGTAGWHDTHGSRMAARSFGRRFSFKRMQVKNLGDEVNPSAILLLAASNGKALWYMTRATGIVALVLLTATVVIGVVASVGWATDRWPRFLSQSVHRNLSLFCLGFVALHVISTASDGYVPIGFADAFVPFLTPYRPIWVGLGALGFDLLLAVLITDRAAAPHRVLRVAIRALVGLPLLADRHVPQPRKWVGHFAFVGPPHRRVV